VHALNGSRFNLFLIGKAARNQQGYWLACKKAAAGNIHFVGRIAQEELVQYYRRAKVHILPSWFETTGLSSLEAAVMGCNVVITDRGDAKEYFNQDACYCDPASPESIYRAVETASLRSTNETLQNKILTHYTWKVAAEKTMEAYRAVLKKNM
jgi:glycosyltransferase involved in cell wall biosynthesis